jgi:hypothetical protein
MIRLSLILFAVAAVAGLSMAILHFRGSSPPKNALAVLHGLFAASGLGVLLMALIKTGFGGTAGTALVLLVLAALGGFALLSWHVKNQRLPSALVIGHALLAVGGFLTLLLAEFALISS